jgi:ribose 5-phosphate isomerase B
LWTFNEPENNSFNRFCVHKQEANHLVFKPDIFRQFLHCSNPFGNKTKTASKTALSRFTFASNSKITKKMASISIAIGSDHAGFQLKQELIKHLSSMGHNVKDFGPASDARVDYPDFAHPVANEVESGKVDFGVIICGSGNGIAMAANKHKGIRAAVCWNREVAELARAHNDANIISLPARFISVEEAKACVDVFLVTAFEGGRHADRVKKIPL